MTETDIGKLFIAGLLPGLIGIIFYMAAVSVTVHLKPELGPTAKRSSGTERLIALKDVWGICLLFFIVMGGIYSGVFTPTETAGIGASGAFFIALLRCKLTFKSLVDTLVSSVRTKAMLFFLVIGAVLFSNFVNLAGLADALKEGVLAMDLSPVLVILAIISIYLLLGCVLESMSMILLTVPVLVAINRQSPSQGFQRLHQITDINQRERP